MVGVQRNTIKGEGKSSDNDKTPNHTPSHTETGDIYNTRSHVNIHVVEQHHSLYNFTITFKYLKEGVIMRTYAILGTEK